MKPRALVFALLLFLIGIVAGRATVPERSLPRPARGPVRAASRPLVVPASLEALPVELTGDETRIIEVFRRASASVVNVTAVALRRDFFSMNVMQIPRGSGSGFVWDDRGHVVTNFHVIQGGNRFLVTLADRSEWEADVVGQAPDKDLAVLRINAPREQLAPLTPGRSSSLLVGQRVLAIGDPFGLDHSLTVGVVSALGRELESPGGRVIHDVIQTDAAINPGNSGGPLLDSSGRLIGVNTAIFSPSGGSAGIGFAVPVDIVSRLVPQLIEHGKPVLPGIGIGAVPDAIAARYDIQGVIVQTVVRGGPAERAGIEGLRRDRRGRLLLGDVIVAVNGEEIEDTNDLLDAFEAIGVGGEATLTLQGSELQRDVTLTLVPIQ